VRGGIHQDAVLDDIFEANPEVGEAQNDEAKVQEASIVRVAGRGTEERVFADMDSVGEIRLDKAG